MIQTERAIYELEMDFKKCFCMSSSHCLHNFKSGSGLQCVHKSKDDLSRAGSKIGYSRVASSFRFKAKCAGSESIL